MVSRTSLAQASFSSIVPVRKDESERAESKCPVTPGKTGQGPALDSSPTIMIWSNGMRRCMKLATALIPIWNVESDFHHSVMTTAMTGPGSRILREALDRFAQRVLKHASGIRLCALS